MLKKFFKDYILGRLGLYSFIVFIFGILLHMVGIIFFLLNKKIFFNVSVPICAVSIFLFIFDIIVLRNFLVKKENIKFEPVGNKTVSVGITAYDDEECIGNAVLDFIQNPNVKEVIVVDNNSKDKTEEEARKVGARVVVEQRQGYGYACIRALKEASKNADIIVLVEGDQTFSSADLKKLLLYLENCDMVIGTRTTKELNSPDSQMDWLMVLGNVFVAKLMQIRFWGTRFTDMGCTYRAIRKEAYEKIKQKLTVGGMHFLPHMLIQALKSELKIIEVPITFKKRAGRSKGVGDNKLRAIFVGLRMILSIFRS